MAVAGDDRTPLLAEEGVVRQRSANIKPRRSRDEGEGKKWTHEDDPDWNPNLPYGGKVYLARRKKPDPSYVRAIEAAVVIGTIAFALYAYYYFDHLHYHVTRGYAHLGYSAAQHQVGQRFLHGLGVEKDERHAMEWFKKAADQGHPHASYNLAVGHLQGIRTDLLSKGDPHRLIAHAASKGVKEAHHALNEICPRGGCD